MRINRTFWAKAEAFPPIVVRLLAKHSRKDSGKPVTNAEIAARAGLSELTVVSISQQLNWSGVDLPTMRAFCSACGVDFENSRHMQRIRTYLRGKLHHTRTSGRMRTPPNFEYLRSSPDWESFYKPLAARFLGSRQNRIQDRSRAQHQIQA